MRKAREPGFRPPIPPRDQLPGLPPTADLDGYVRLMQQCWQYDPTARCAVRTALPAACDHPTGPAAAAMEATLCAQVALPCLVLPPSALCSLFPSSQKPHRPSSDEVAERLDALKCASLAASTEEAAAAAAARVDRPGGGGGAYMGRSLTATNLSRAGSNVSRAGSNASLAAGFAAGAGGAGTVGGGGGGGGGGAVGAGGSGVSAANSPVPGHRRSVSSSVLPQVGYIQV